MTNRLVLNLNHVATHPDGSSDRSAGELPAPVFARRTVLNIDNIGASISIRTDEPEDDHWDEQQMTLEMQQVQVKTDE